MEIYLDMLPDDILDILLKITRNFRDVTEDFKRRYDYMMSLIGAGNILPNEYFSSIKIIDDYLFHINYNSAIRLNRCLISPLNEEQFENLILLLNDIISISICYLHKIEHDSEEAGSVRYILETLNPDLIYKLTKIISSEIRKYKASVYVEICYHYDFTEGLLEISIGDNWKKFRVALNPICRYTLKHNNGYT